MFFPEGRVRIFVYGEPVNMRLSFDGLYALVRHTMQLDALDGNL
jgi:transposase